MREKRQAARQANDERENEPDGVRNGSEQLRTVAPTETETETEPNQDHNPKPKPKPLNGHNASASGFLPPCIRKQPSEDQGEALTPETAGKVLADMLGKIWPLEFAGSIKRGQFNRNTFTKHGRTICERYGASKAKEAIAEIVNMAQQKQACCKAGELNNPIAALNKWMADKFNLQPSTEAVGASESLGRCIA